MHSMCSKACKHNSLCTIKCLAKNLLSTEFVGNPPVRRCSVGSLLVGLSKQGAGSRLASLLRSLCCFLGWHAETAGWWQRMSEDAFLDAPVPRAAKRARRIDPHLREQVAQMASKGGLCRTGGQASNLLQRVRRWKVRLLGRSVANEAVGQRMVRYLGAGRAAFSTSSVQVASVALDASRVGGRDCLYLALFSPQLVQPTPPARHSLPTHV
eukprot:5471132-Lingulodinium_polyedra.AAC.2